MKKHRQRYVIKKAPKTAALKTPTRNSTRAGCHRHPLPSCDQSHISRNVEGRLLVLSQRRCPPRSNGGVISDFMRKTRRNNLQTADECYGERSSPLHFRKSLTISLTRDSAGISRAAGVSSRDLQQLLEASSDDMDTTSALIRCMKFDPSRSPLAGAF
jgi:hypothetical protein